MTAPTKRRTMTLPGDARSSVGQLRGPDGRGQLLIIDEATYDHEQGRTRLWLRPVTGEDTAAVEAAAARAADDMAAEAWDLPSTLSGPLGYVDFTCALCHTAIRQHGITDATKAWGLCERCLATPAGQAAVNAKRAELRKQRDAQLAATVEEARQAASGAAGPVTIRILGLASGQYRTAYDGQWLVEYDPTRPGVDPDGNRTTAHIVTTADRSQARAFPDGVAAWEEWKRESGRPYPRNAPLTAFSISVTGVDVPDDPEHTATVEAPWTGGQP